MILPIRGSDRQACAEGFAATAKRFASVTGARQSDPRSVRPTVRADRCDDTTPSPWRRSGRVLARPSFAPAAHRLVAVRTRQEFCFSCREIVVRCRVITNQTRGRKTCSHQSSFWAPLLLLRWQAACRTPRHAVWQVQAPAFCWRTRWTPTLPPGPSSAALRVLQPAVSMSGCRPATDPDLTVAARDPACLERHPGQRPGGVSSCLFPKVS